MISLFALLILQLNILIDSFSRYLIRNRDSSPPNIVEFNNYHTLLPHDILIDIFLRLPAKSLFRFKSVCKEWHYIISSPDFINMHYNHPSNLTRLVLYTYGPSRSGPNDLDWDNKYCTYSYYPDCTLERHEVPDHLLLWGDISALCGPCNGIYCIYVSKNKFALWNPTTRRLRPILCSPSFEFSEIGFGIDPVTGDYKIVLIQCRPRMSPCYALYTSSSNSWKYLEEESLRDPDGLIRHDFSATGSNAFLNGFYYWLKLFAPYTLPTILAFDLHDGTFQEIEGPPGILDSNGFTQLHLFNDSIAIVFNDVDFERRPIEIWLMEKKRYWIKFSSVVLPYPESCVLGFCAWNKILLSVLANRVLMYDLDTHSTKQLSVDEEHSHYLMEVLPIHYKESLFSIKCEHGNRDFDTRSVEGLQFLGYEKPDTRIFRLY